MLNKMERGRVAIRFLKRANNPDSPYRVRIYKESTDEEYVIEIEPSKVEERLSEEVNNEQIIIWAEQWIPIENNHGTYKVELKYTSIPNDEEDGIITVQEYIEEHFYNHPQIYGSTTREELAENLELPEVIAESRNAKAFYLILRKLEEMVMAGE